MSKSVAVVGAGIFGVCSAIALAERGWDVRLLDPGPLPHPLAASTDISKIVRADYGAGELYADLMVEAFPGGGSGTKPGKSTSTTRPASSYWRVALSAQAATSTRASPLSKRETFLLSGLANRK